MQTSELEQLTYKAVVEEHQRLDIDFDQTIAVIKLLFPTSLEAAIALWNTLEAEKLGVLTYAQK